MNQKIKDIANNIDEIQESLSFLEETYGIEEKTIVAISGGADSMFAATIIYQFWISKNWNEDNLYFLYCDHAVREHNDIACIQGYLGSERLEIATREKSEKNTENDLRKRRYEQIHIYAKKTGAKILITGHHLSDRIESTFLNMLRGCGIPGFISMQRIDNNNGIFDGKIVRPLLHMAKRYITHICKKYNIPYVQDKTNSDTTISKRNKLRHDIIDPLLLLANKHGIQENSFERSMQYIYKNLEELTKDTCIQLQDIPLIKHWKAKRAYRWKVEKNMIDSQQVKNLLSTLKISNNTTQKNIKDITDFLKEKKSGHKYINKTYFFVSHGNIYIIQGPKKFWKNPIKKIPKDINTLFNSEVTDKKGRKSRRLATKDEKIHGKTWSKRCINQKIPLFRRSYIPLVTDKNNTIKPYIFDFIKKI